MARKTKITELGLEIECCKCGEFYPADTEFFYKQNRSKWGLHSWCKACYEEQPSVIAKRARWLSKRTQIYKKIGKHSEDLERNIIC